VNTQRTAVGGTLGLAGQPHARLTDATPLADEDARRADTSPRAVVIGDGPRWRSNPPTGAWDAIVYLRTRQAVGHNGEQGAGVVIDYHDPQWPVIRHLDPVLADLERRYLPESRAFFGIRAATWDTKFGDDLPAYASAIAEARLPAGSVVLDVGCGLVQHLPDPQAGLAELARVTRAGGLLVVFHPSGRAALAARHGRELRPDEPLGPARFGPLLAAAGWRLAAYDDAGHRFFATARRVGR
jgi:SAM-dependent methyltransferase